MIFDSVVVMPGVSYRRVISAFVRVARGRLSQPKFEDKTKIKQSTISALERAVRDVLPEHIEAILEACDIDVISMCHLMEEIAKRLEAEQRAGNVTLVPGTGALVAEKNLPLALTAISEAKTRPVRRRRKKQRAARQPSARE